MCTIPSNDEELRELVVKLQLHNHTPTCFKKQNQNMCRFHFPRPLSISTNVLDPEEAIRSGGRFCAFKRAPGEEMINSYNPKILKFWKANIDVQPCGSSQGVAHYIAKYIAKSEPTEINKSIKNALQSVGVQGNFGRKIFAVQMAI